MFKTLNLIAVILTIISVIFLAACGTSSSPSLATEEIKEPVQSIQIKATETPTLQLPTVTAAPPTPTLIPPTPTTAPIGYSRVNPYPSTEIVSVSGWDIQLLEVMRGDPAWTAIKNANMFNVSPPEGMEYILVKIRARCNFSDNDEHLLDEYDFGITGSKRIRYSAGMVTVVEPEPSLRAELYAGGEVEGWAAYLIFKEDSNLILVFHESEKPDDMTNIRYIAIDEGATVTTPKELMDIPPIDTGVSRQNPLPKSEKLITDDWEISVVTDLRGPEAWTLIQNAYAYNDPPPDGYEYVALMLHVRYIGANEHGAKVDTYFMNLTGSSGIVFDSPYLLEPFPPLAIGLYPGGEHEGWVVFLSLIGETNLMLMMNESFSFSSEVNRFIALDEGASVAIPADLADIKPNDLGIMRTSPAALNEVVVSEDWQLSVLEVKRGADALMMVQRAGSYNPVPPSGMEYIAARVRIRYIDTAEQAVSIDGYFSSVGNMEVVYDMPYIFNLERMLSGSLFPGGEMEGWIVLQAGVGETNMTLIFKPMFDFTDVNKRFLKLE